MEKILFETPDSKIHVIHAYSYKFKKFSIDRTIPYSIDQSHLHIYEYLGPIFFANETILLLEMNQSQILIPYS